MARIFVSTVLTVLLFIPSLSITDSATGQDMQRYEKVRISRIITRGDHSYIRFAPRTTSREDDENVVETEILMIKNAFVANHPELTITGWQVQSMVYVASYSSADAVMYHGTWVDHKPSGKQKPTPKAEDFPPNKR